MIAVTVRIDNLAQLRANFQKAPTTTLRWLSKATAASIAEVEKEAVDRNLQFKWPRHMRTGMLQQSFSFGRFFAPGGLYASIGPTVSYAPYVYFGTRRGMVPNRYMDRIAGTAEPQIGKHFERAVDGITSELANI